MTKRKDPADFVKRGAPSKYNAEVQRKADEYVDGGYIAQDDVVPSLAGLCCAIGIHSEQTLYNWRKEFPEFLDTLERMSSTQHRVALSRGLDGTFNSAITKLLLHNYGYSDKSAVDHTTAGEKMPTQIVFVGIDDEAES